MWNKLSDCAPPDGKRVLIYDIGGDKFIAEWDGDWETFVDGSGTHFNDSCGYEIIYWAHIVDMPDPHLKEFGMTEKEGMEMFQRFSEGQNGAKTIISMCTDYLLGNLQTGVFAENLSTFASFYKDHAEQEKKEHVHFPQQING